MSVLNFFIEKNQKTYIIGVLLERRLMVGQEILVLFIMVRIRALQPPFASAMLRVAGHPSRVAKAKECHT